MFFFFFLFLVLKIAYSTITARTHIFNLKAVRRRRSEAAEGQKGRNRGP